MNTDKEDRGRRYPLDGADDEATPPTATVRSAPRDLAGSLLGLCLLIAFHASQTAHWIRLDTRPPAWDQSVQLETAWDLKEALAKGDWQGALRMPPKPGMPPFPLLYHLSLQPALGGADPAAGALWVNWAYMALLCFSIWGLGRHFIGEWEGLGAAVLFTCVPEMSWLARETLLDLALCAWVAAAYWALAASDSFRRKGPSLLFGALFAAAMMTKWSAFSYFLPVVVPLFGALTEGEFGSVGLAAGSAAALAGPWYLAQAPVLLPRLFEAAADQAVPVWKGGAVFTYLTAMGDGLELPLLALGLVAVAVPSPKRRTLDAWLLPAWFAAALVFWTLVPNRQLRYLLPGLIPLALLAMGPWPRKLVIAACALSLASAWNYPRGVLPRLRLDLGLPIALFRTDAPLREDWKLGEMLKTADSLREPSLPFANVAFVANHPRLNGPNLNWERKRLGLKGLRIRGVNKRYTEFCEFVLVKTGSLGPASVTGQLPEVQKVMLDPGRWFGRGWLEVRRWPLPDATEGVLFQRRRFDKAPVGEGKTRIDYFEEGNFKAEGLELDFGAWDAARGVYPRVSARARSVTIRGLEVTGLDLVLEGVSLISAAEQPGLDKKVDPLAEPRFLRLDALAVRSASVSQEALAFFVNERVKGLEGAGVRFDAGAAALEGRWRGRPVRVAVEPRLLSDRSGLEVLGREASFALIPLPLKLLGAGRFVLPFAPSSELPFRIAVPSLSLKEGRLSVGG